MHTTKEMIIGIILMYALAMSVVMLKHFGLI